MIKTKELEKKEKQINEILFKKRDRNALIINREKFEDLAGYILDSTLIGYPWFAKYDALDHNLYVFNSAVEPSANETVNLLNIKNLDQYYTSIYNVGIKILAKKELPLIGDDEQIKSLIIETKHRLGI